MPFPQFGSVVDTVALMTRKMKGQDFVLFKKLGSPTVTKVSIIW